MTHVSSAVFDIRLPHFEINSPLELKNCGSSNAAALSLYLSDTDEKTNVRGHVERYVSSWLPQVISHELLHGILKFYYRTSIFIR